ncbi:MAG: response regulator [Lachnospiraceae bacterium]|nr:response regulator [Lachnospiraceae bacterium]
MEKKEEIHQSRISSKVRGGFFTYRAGGENELIYVNKGVISLYGCKTEEEFREYTGNSFRGMVHPDDFPRVEASIERQISQNEDEQDYVEYRIIRKDGIVCYVEDFGHLVYSGDEDDIFYVYINEITESVLVMEGTLQNNGPEERRVLMDVLASTVHEYREIYYVDLQNDYLRMIFPDYCDIVEDGNYTKTMQWHFDSGKIISQGEERTKKIKGFLHLDNVIKALEDKDTVEMKYKRKAADGTDEWCLTTFVARERIGGMPRTAVLTIRRIEDLIRNEMVLKEALVQAQYANKAKSTFLSNMSHDMRTPMNAILGFASLAETNIDNKNRVMDYLKKIQSSSNHLLSLINDILDMSHIESGKVVIQEKACNISERMHGMMHLILPQIQAKQLDFSIKAEEIRNEDVYTDPLRIEQAFINVLSNAIKFTAPGGAVTVIFRQLECDKQGYGTYEFVVQDTGIGMSEGFIKHIFEPFERESTSTISGQQGTGLGMTITKSIVDMMDGKINVESTPGKGSTVTIQMTFKLQENEKETENVVIRELEGQRVLVVDDDFSVCCNVTRMLEELGMRSEWTLSGKEALYRAQLAIDKKDPFATYIVNWKMPTADGVEVVRGIREIAGDTAPAIVLSTYDWGEIEEEAKAAGVTAFCSKPLFLSDLKNVMIHANRVTTSQEVSMEDVRSFMGSRILVVEDNDLNREIAVEFLQEAGFQVETAADGTFAVDMVKESEEGYYDAILMDIQMPIMDGYVATQTIRSLPRKDTVNLPIIALSANAFEEDRERAVKSGMNAYLAKPLDEDLMFGTLEKYIALHREIH